jgi:hypothetical protein
MISEFILFTGLSKRFSKQSWALVCRMRAIGKSKMTRLLLNDAWKKRHVPNSFLNVPFTSINKEQMNELIGEILKSSNERAKLSISRLEANGCGNSTLNYFCFFRENSFLSEKVYPCKKGSMV